MSLLHTALKKAERDGGGKRETRLVIDGEEPKGRGAGLLRAVLIVSVVAALLFLVSTRLFRRSGGEGPRAAAPVTISDSATPLGIGAGPPAPELLERASRLIEQRRWAEAKTELEKAVILEPRNAEAYNNLGLALKKLGQKDQAAEQYRKALSLEPTCAECLNNLGVLTLEARQPAAARENFLKAIESRPDYADPYFHMALVAEAEGKAQEAREYYTKFTEKAEGIDAAFLLKIQRRIASL